LIVPVPKTADRLAGAQTAWQTRLFPNPNTGQFTIEVTWAGQPEALEYRLVDIAGRTLETGRILSRGRTIRHGVNVQGLAGGLYWVELRDARTTTRHKVVIYGR
ncbi:MAG: T9SS type A sorting domain-containing protein, partial [Bacteroidota bacterium]